MAADVFVVRGPAGSGKTQALIDQLRSSPTTATWIAPTERACEAVLRRLGSGDAPLVTTLSDAARRIIEKSDGRWRFAPEAHQRLLLDEIIAQLHHSRSLRYYAKAAATAGFGEAVFDLMTELKSRGVAADALRTALGGEKLQARDRDIAAIYEAYQQRLAKLRLLDRETAYLEAARVVRAGHADVSRIFVDGFVDFTPPQLELLGAWIERASQVWMTLPSDRVGDERRVECFQRPQQMVEAIREWAGKRLTLLQIDAGSNYQPPGRSPGLAELEYQLFSDSATKIDVGAGDVLMIEGPGKVGELRMLARDLKQRLREGVLPTEIVVTARSLNDYGDLIAEIFTEYGLPFEIDRQRPLSTVPVIRTLLHAARLATDQFPFAATTALLRNTMLRPVWPEAADPEIALESEVMLRSLGIPRGRDVYLQAAAGWAAAPEPPLEDDEAELPSRRQQHKRAQISAPFLQRFFKAWDLLPATAPFADHADALRRFAAELGFDQDAEDQTALQHFFECLQSWADFDSRRGSSGEMSGEHFLALANRLGQSAVYSAKATAAGIRVVAAETARALDCAELVVLGLSEGSFPNLAVGGPIYTDREREELHEAGLPLRTVLDRLADEKLLFLQLVAKPRNRLTLSYPAVDASGSALLPCSFLAAVQDSLSNRGDCTRRRTMLLEGLSSDPPRCPAEYRLRWALMSADQRPARPEEPFDNLRRAEQIVARRFHDRDYTAFDGLLGNRSVRRQIANDFAAEIVLSPTQLETYAECPFKFFVRHVLNLEALFDPAETIESAPRGQVVHRALSRFHRRRQGAGRHVPDADAIAELIAEMESAVDEVASRAGSLALRALWRFEARWLRRMAQGYAAAWTKFFERCTNTGVCPQPHSFEFDFGLPVENGEPEPALVVSHNGEEVRVAGRIDRIDVATLGDGRIGYWIIDYKTGSSAGYSAADVETVRLQLPLYAMKVEQWLADARPIGLGYWFLREVDGLKIVAPARHAPAWLNDAGEWAAERERVTERVVAIGRAIRAGRFPLHPHSEDCTARCDFGQMCRIAQSRGVEKSLGDPR